MSGLVRSYSAVKLGSAGDIEIDITSRQFHCAFQLNESGIMFIMVTRLLEGIFALKPSSVSLYSAYLIA